MKKNLLPFFFVAFSYAASAQVNWANNISCILYSHCTTCHNPNGIAPFSLLGYSDAFANATEIKTQVQNRTMPPYLADVSYQQYAHQKTLTQAEIDQITDWVDNGAPAGDTTLAMTPPVYPAGSVLNNPDFSASIGTYAIPALQGDEYRCFVISNPFAADEYITAIEVLPGNRVAVHHVLIYSDDSDTPLQLDSADADPGYVSFGGTGSASSKLIGGFVPGSDPYYLPANIGMFVAAGSRIVIQVHYPVSASGLTDSTRVNFIMSSVALREAGNVPALDHYFAITDGPLFIPANTVKTFHAQYTVPVDVSILSVAPHAHLVCTSMASYAVTPSSDTIWFEHIPHWDFHWQGAYYFQKPLHIPAGTVLYGEATYDNTANNPENPNDPPLDVSLGEATTDEMMLFYFVYVLYQAGDEGIVIDTSGHLPHYQDCSSFTAVPDNDFESQLLIYPNPARGIVTIENNNFQIDMVSVADVYGKQVRLKDFSSGGKRTDIKINIADLESGIYFVQVAGAHGKIANRKLVVSGK
jgi:hypothetical protein